jgi:hypothetical protein
MSAQVFSQPPQNLNIEPDVENVVAHAGEHLHQIGLVGVSVLLAVLT